MDERYGYISYINIRWVAFIKLGDVSKLDSILATTTKLTGSIEKVRIEYVLQKWARRNSVESVCYVGMVFT